MWCWSKRVHKAIDDACDRTNSRLATDDSSHDKNNKQHHLPSSWHTRRCFRFDRDFEGVERSSEIKSSATLILFIGSSWKNVNQVWICRFFWAYSTWDGRVLYVNKIIAPTQELETSLLYTLADVAVQLEGQRLVWQVRPLLLMYIYTTIS
jgi:hypothetical protein